MARDRAHRSRPGQHPHPRHLPLRPVPTPASPAAATARAIGAVRHSIIVACWHMLTTGEIYRDAGGDYFTRLDPDKQTRRLVAQLERLGHTVTLQEAAA